LLLLVNPQATFMLGVYTQQRMDGRFMLLGWALGRTEHDLAEAASRFNDLLGMPVAQPN
jgi:hypothetical protein